MNHIAIIDLEEFDGLDRVAVRTVNHATGHPVVANGSNCTNKVFTPRRGLRFQSTDQEIGSIVGGHLRKMMRNAMELFMLVAHSPVLRTMRPKIPIKEARHLQLEQLKALLDYVAERPYGLGIWLQAFLGLRVGELQAPPGIMWI